ncbi:MAG: response regulator [Lachnospiraceae bacterium]|nr:response regulator [Lachnospiraceae bacterium]
MTELRVIIIDEDRERREKVAKLLPEYMDAVPTGTGEGAIERIKRDAEGKLPDLVILCGDDTKHFGLYVFDWMVNRSGDSDIAAIPVIVLTDDEFSDASLEFLEIGDVMFYEGEIEEGGLFSAVSGMMDEADFRPEPVEPSYEEMRSIDRLMGCSVPAPGDEQRAVVLDMETRIENLEAALVRGRKRAEDIRTLLTAAQQMKCDKGDGSFDTFSKSDKGDGSSDTVSKKTAGASSFLKKAREKAEAGDAVGRLKQRAMEDPGSALGAQGTVRMEDRPAEPAKPVHAPDEKKTVVIVDDDLKTRKLCSLFLTQKYNVIAFDSGIKTVDFFIRNRVDLLLINPVLEGMSGLSTVASIRMHPGGTELPVMFIVGDNYTGDRARLYADNVVGILNKPIKQGVIAQAVEGFFEGRA